MKHGVMCEVREQEQESHAQTKISVHAQQFDQQKVGPLGQNQKTWHWYHEC